MLRVNVVLQYIYFPLAFVPVADHRPPRVANCILLNITASTPSPLSQHHLPNTHPLLTTTSSPYLSHAQSSHPQPQGYLPRIRVNQNTPLIFFHSLLQPQPRADTISSATPADTGASAATSGVSDAYAHLRRGQLWIHAGGEGAGGVLLGLCEGVRRIIILLTMEGPEWGEKGGKEHEGIRGR